MDKEECAFAADADKIANEFCEYPYLVTDVDCDELTIESTVEARVYVINSENVIKVYPKLCTPWLFSQLGIKESNSLFSKNVGVLRNGEYANNYFTKGFWTYVGDKKWVFALFTQNIK